MQTQEEELHPSLVARLSKDLGILQQTQKESNKHIADLDARLLAVEGVKKSKEDTLWEV